MAVRTQPIAWAVSLTLVASVALVPAPVLAQRVSGGSGGGRVVVGSPAGSRAFAHHRSAPGSFAPRSFFSHRGFAPFGAVVVYAPLAYGSPDYYDPPLAYGSPAYYDPPVAYAPPAMYAPPTGGTLSLAPPPSPMPTVVEFPTGRYERRGDGITAPYQWVWIPNPPAAPPAAPPPAAPTAAPAPSSRNPEPSRPTPLYRWTDQQGVVHLTDRRDSIPDRYRQ